MRDKLWINRWTERHKESAVSNAKQGISFLGGYNMTDYKNVLFELWVGLNMYKGSPTSCYSNIIPPNGSEVIKVRLSDHRSSENEWAQNELTGYPNRRYSIVIFSMKSMPDESKQDIVETEWLSYLSNGIPVYEKCFNRFYLKDTFPKLISILQDIYSGGAPEDNTIRVDLTENKQYKTRYNMKKTIRLSERDLHKIVNESVRRIINEDYKYDAFLKARKLYKDFNDFINLVKKANNEVKGAYSDKLKILIDAQGIMSEFAFTSEGGNEGSGFSSDGVSCF